MSLNGLDSPAVQEAYQAAIAEVGGWFLLKYTARDSVDLLGQGRNGVSEARHAITAYTEPSPLYGLLMYRRRKILIKHIPEGTSRLLQARTTVHLSDILERYSPYETLLEISSGDALNDTALAASFQLHTASRPSPSPLPSSRLDEIREDGEDGGAVPELASRSSTAPERTTNSQRYKAERRADQLMRKKADRPDRSSSLLLPTAGDSALAPSSRLAVSGASPRKPSLSQFLVRDESGRTSVTPLESAIVRDSGVESRASNTSTRSAESPHAAHDGLDSASTTTAGASESTDATEMPSSPERTERNHGPQPREVASMLPGRELSPDRRPSTSSKTVSVDERSAQTSLDEDPYDLRKYDEWFKPKVKLGPRPVATPDQTKRPAVARVSALPANFRSGFKKQDPVRPRSSSSTMQDVNVSAFPPVPRTAPFKPLPPPPVPDVPEYKPRPTSRGSVKSAPSHKSTGMTSDKLRLMKAIELRKRQLRQSQDQQSTKSTIDKHPKEAKVSEVHSRLDNVPEQKAQEQEAERVIAEDEPQPSKADSGIDLKSGRHDDQESTRSQPQLLDDTPIPAQVQPELPRPRQEVASTSVSPHGETEQSNIGMEGTASADPTAISHADAISSSESLTPTERPTSTSRAESEMVPVPTIVMADGSALDTSGSNAQNTEEDTGEISLDEDESDSSPHLEAPASPRRQNSDLARRRRGFVEPLQVNVGSGNPDDIVSDDDEFLEELQSATVQEAKPVMVARSTVPTRRPSAETVGSVRSVNITRTTTLDRLTPVLTKRPMSPISPTTDPGDPVSAVSRNVSSGISKRIQALAEMSSRPLTPEAAAQPEPRERRPHLKTRPASYRRQSSHRGASPASSNPSSESTPTWNVQHDPVTNRKSVSVTARIVRPSAADEGAPGDAGLQQSELKINQGGMQNEKMPPPINTSMSPSAASSPALSPALSWNSGENRQMLSGSFFGRHKGSTSPGGEASPPFNSARNTSAASLTSNDGSVATKEGGRTSRFFKRMSNMNFSSSAKNRSNAQPVLGTTTGHVNPENNNIAPASKKLDRLSVATEKADMPPPVLVGDLNVQFPDSLLWKRRIVTIDESGNLQFAIAQAMEIHKGVALKKFHFSSLQLPYAPDVDTEELAHSLVLELHDGTSLQLACEDAMTQRQVLHLLKSYWKAWTAPA